MSVQTKTKEWKKVRLDECFNVQQGKQVSKKNRIGDNQKPFLRTANVFWGKLDLSVLDQMNFTAEEEKKYALQKGDLLVCEGGDIGRTAMWNEELSDCYYQNHLHRLRKINDDIDENFALLYLQYAFVYANLFFGRANITTIPNLSKSRLSELEIARPPIDDQKAIARVLITIKNAITSQEELILKLKELKQGMMCQLFTKGSKGEKTKMTEIGEIPESWDIKILGDYLEKTKTNDPTKKPDDEFIYIDVSAVSREFFKIISHQKLLGKDAPSRARKNIKTGDIIFATVRPTLQRIAVVPEKYNDQICSTGYCVLRPNKELDRDFLFHYLCSDAVLQYVGGLQSGVSYPAIRDGVLFEMNLPFPKLEEQKKIGKTLSAIDEKIESTHKKLLNYRNLFNTLLHELMSGERSVKYEQ